MIRMRRYRNNFAEILSSSNSNLTKKRFLRLFGLSLALLLIMMPGEFYLLSQNLAMPLIPYSWALVHGPDWGHIMLIPSEGTVAVDRWLQIAVGFAVFIFFGLGSDALEMYRKWLLAVGLGRIFPSLQRQSRPQKSFNHSLSSGCSMGSRARLLFSKKWSRNSMISL